MKAEVMPTRPFFEGLFQTIFFELMNGNQRQACSLKVQHVREHEAMQFFKNNWTKIGGLARSCIDARVTENGEVKLRVIN
jgi:hypothetical protein